MEKMERMRKKKSTDDEEKNMRKKVRGDGKMEKKRK